MRQDYRRRRDTTVTASTPTQITMLGNGSVKDQARGQSGQAGVNVFRLELLMCLARNAFHVLAESLLGLTEVIHSGVPPEDELCHVLLSMLFAGQYRDQETGSAFAELIATGYPARLHPPVLFIFFREAKEQTFRIFSTPALQFLQCHPFRIA